MPAAAAGPSPVTLRGISLLAAPLSKFSLTPLILNLIEHRIHVRRGGVARKAARQH
jgi:hypothetical protein